MMVNKKFRNPGVASFGVLIVMLMFAIGGWGTEHLTYTDVELTHPASWRIFADARHIFSLMTIVAAVVLSWLSPSPLRSSIDSRDPAAGQGSRGAADEP